MTKCKRKLLPAEPYEIDALESWFSDLSAEGLHVQKANALFATFIEGEKKRLLFRMEPKQDAIFPALDESQAEERNAQHREKGWSFVCGLNRFYVYAAEEGTADYFATPQEEGAYYPDNLKGNKALNNRYTELLLTLLMIAGFIYITLRLTTYEWVTGSTSPVCNPAFLLLVIFSGQRIRGAIRLQNSLAAGEPHHQPTDWQAPHLRRKHWLYQVWMLGIIAFIFLPFLPNVFSFSDRPIAEVKQPLPMISLAELENDPDFYAVDSYYQRDDGPEIEWWEREANLVNSYPTFGSPVDLAYNQAGRISDKTDATGRPYESVLWVEYRRLAFFLSPKEYIKEYLGRAYETYETTALEDTPFDYALLAKGKNHTRLYLVSGQTLLELDYYYGYADLTKHYDLYEKALKEMQKNGFSDADIFRARQEINKLDRLVYDESASVPEAEPIDITKLKPGDWVFVPKLNSNAQITELRGKKATVAIGGMHTVLECKDLSCARNVPDETKKASAHSVKYDLKTKAAKTEINLLGQTLSEAIANVDAFLDDAVMCGLNEVRVVHGIGTGVLRKGLHEHFKSHPNVASFRLGKYGEGEGGVTVVTLK